MTLACEPQPLSPTRMETAQVDPVKYRGFNQATVTGRTWGCRVSEGCVACPSAPADPRPKSELSRQPRCAATNRQPGGSFVGFRLPADCHSTPATRTVLASSTTPPRQFGARTQQPPSPRWATSAASPTRAPLSILEIRIDVSRPRTGSPPCDSAEVVRPVCAMLCAVLCAAVNRHGMRVAAEHQHADPRSSYSQYPSLPSP
jgi:hypothetical protein